MASSKRKQLRKKNERENSCSRVDINTSYPTDKAAKVHICRALREQTRYMPRNTSIRAPEKCIHGRNIYVDAVQDFKTSVI